MDLAMEWNVTQGSPNSLTKRFGSLARMSWAPLFEVALASRKPLGLQACEFELIEAILLSHRAPGVWESVAQATLAKRRGVDRTTVNREISALRNKGFLAVRPDASRRPSPAKMAPYFYCLDPYLAALTKRAAQRSGAALAQRLHLEADARFGRFVGEVRLLRWDWRLADLGSSPEATEMIARTFAERHQLRLPDLVEN